jgi:hypothetical protein
MSRHYWTVVCKVSPLSHIKNIFPPPSLSNLKVHKIENFFDSDFGICIISLLVMSKYSDFTKKILDWAIIGGGTIFLRSPRTTRNEKNFELGPKNFFFFFNFGP